MSKVSTCPLPKSYWRTNSLGDLSGGINSGSEVSTNDLKIAVAEEAPANPLSHVTSFQSLTSEDDKKNIWANSKTSPPHSPRRRSTSGASPYHRGGRNLAFERRGGQVGKGVLSFEYSDFGTGDFRTPSFIVVDTFNGSSISPLRYRRHAIYKGKLPMPDNLPGIRFLHEDEATTLVVTMADVASSLEVDLVYGSSPTFHELISRLHHSRASQL